MDNWMNAAPRRPLGWDAPQATVKLERAADELARTASNFMATGAPSARDSLGVALAEYLKQRRGV